MRIYFSKPLLIIASCFILLFLFICYYLAIPFQDIIYPDTKSYIESANSIYFHFRGNNARPMILALIHGFPMLFNQETSFVIVSNIIINVICFFGTIFLVYKMAQSYFSKNIALLIGLFSVTIISLMAFTFHMLSEHIYLFIITLSFYYLNLYYHQKKYSFLIYFLSLSLISILIRPGALFIVIIFLVIFSKIFYHNIKQKINYLLYGSLFLILVQCTGMKYQFGNFTVSYIDATTYYNYLGSKADCYRKGTVYNQIKNPRAEYMYSTDFSLQKQLASDDLKEQLKNNSLNLLKAYFDNLYGNSASGCVIISDLKNVNQSKNFDSIKFFFLKVSQFQNIVLTLLTFCFSIFILVWKRRKNIFFTTIAFYSIYIFGVSGISCDQGDRFHIILFPYTLMLIYFAIHKPKTT